MSCVTSEDEVEAVEIEQRNACLRKYIESRLEWLEKENEAKKKKKKLRLPRCIEKYNKKYKKEDFFDTNIMDEREGVNSQVKVWNPEDNEYHAIVETDFVGR
jgi:hypothetical protein